jgi:alkanesulfonate monooxygenase SsuD/methylene tetrahydromethanopterin reductase-like flavin-dependent oxidoreductase (luciferase family)
VADNKATALTSLPQTGAQSGTKEVSHMKIGAVMFFTTDSMQPAPLARALEERGFESLWVPEHTHIPSSRKTPYPAGGPLIRPYYDILDPFLALNTAATVTTKLKIGTGIALLT